jgi:hypothetical protein
VQILELAAPQALAPDDVVIAVRAARGTRPPLRRGGWSARVRGGIDGGRGVGAAVNTARGGAAAAIEAVANGGRLATITGDQPRPEPGVTVADVYVRTDGARLAAPVAALADGMLSLHLARGGGRTPNQCGTI